MVLSGGDESAVFEDVDEVGVHDGGESVCDDEDGVVAAEVCQDVADLAFVVGVEVGGGFVEEEDFPAGEQGAGDGQALALPARESRPRLPDHGVQTLRRSGSEIVQFDHRQSLET